MREVHCLEKTIQLSFQPSLSNGKFLDIVLIGFQLFVFCSKGPPHLTHGTCTSKALLASGVDEDEGSISAPSLCLSSGSSNGAEEKEECSIEFEGRNIEFEGSKFFTLDSNTCTRWVKVVNVVGFSSVKDTFKAKSQEVASPMQSDVFRYPP